MLSDESIRALQDIWEEEFGETIPDSEAMGKGAELIEIFQLVAPQEVDCLPKAVVGIGSSIKSESRFREQHRKTTLD
ncbi:hypothetical protein HYV44_01640 [Candidatus Microgenomates bacterium]|nr:hypothetical protein [Candidatus Microgenomates bacterium]